jgi:hypothetical protein
MNVDSRLHHLLSSPFDRVPAQRHDVADPQTAGAPGALDVARLKDVVEPVVATLEEPGR